MYESLRAIPGKGRHAAHPPTTRIGYDNTQYGYSKHATIPSEPIGWPAAAATIAIARRLARDARAGARGASMALPQAHTAAFDQERTWMLEGHAQASWRQGMRSVRDARLDEVLEQLRAYQPGLIRVSPETAALRVFGVFSLDEPRRTLQARVGTDLALVSPGKSVRAVIASRRATTGCWD